MAQNMKVAISSDFLTAFASLPRDAQGKVMEFSNRFRNNPVSETIKYERVPDSIDDKMNYVSVVEIKTFIPMHRLMMEYLRASIFKSEINVLSKMKADSKEKLEYQQKINLMFTEHMYKFSENHIKPYKLLDPNNDNNDYVFGYW